jgi:hypothetical protein
VEGSVSAILHNVQQASGFVRQCVCMLLLQLQESVSLGSITAELHAYRHAVETGSDDILERSRDRGASGDDASEDDILGACRLAERRCTRKSEDGGLCDARRRLRHED